MDLNFCQSPPEPHISLGRFFFQESKLREMCGGRSRQMSPYSLWAECEGCLRTSSAGRSGRSATGGAWGKRRDQSRRRVAHFMSAYGWDDKWTQDSRLEPCGDVQCMTMRWYKNETTFVLMCCVEVSGSGRVVIGVGIVIVQRHHASITNYWILTFSPICELVVRLYVVIVKFFLVAIYCALSPICHSSNERCPSMMRSVLFYLLFLLHQPLQICFWHLFCPTPESSPVSPIIFPLPSHLVFWSLEA